MTTDATPDTPRVRPVLMFRDELHDLLERVGHADRTRVLVRRAGPRGVVFVLVTRRRYG